MEAHDLDSLLFLYQKYSSAENKSPRTIETTCNAVKLFQRFLGNTSDVDQVTAEDLRRFIRELQAKSKWCDHPTINSGHGELSPHTVACYVRSIRAFWSWLHREEFILDNPFKRVKVPGVPQSLINTFSPDQVRELLSVISRKTHKGYRDYAIILLLFGLGLRISEISSLTIDKVNFTTGIISVLGKGAKERALYMPPTIFKAMFKYYEKWRPKVSAGYFFVTDDGRQLSRFNFEHRMQKYGHKAGITDVACRPHVLRHSFSIEFLRADGDIFTL